jgi:hypothetical protein
LPLVERNGRVGRGFLASIVVAWTLTLGSALADDRVESAHVGMRGSSGLFDEALPVRDEKLEALRGKMSALISLDRVGVILWDEPRKGVPPYPGAKEPPLTHVTGGGTVIR